MTRSRRQFAGTERAELARHPAASAASPPATTSASTTTGVRDAGETLVEKLDYLPPTSPPLLVPHASTTRHSVTHAHSQEQTLDRRTPLTTTTISSSRDPPVVPATPPVQRRALLLLLAPDAVVRDPHHAGGRPVSGYRRPWGQAGLLIARGGIRIDAYVKVFTFPRLLIHLDPHHHHPTTTSTDPIVWGPQFSSQPLTVKRPT